LAFSIDEHPQHRAALRQWNELRRPSFCRLTALGLMRLLCNKHVMAAQTFQPEEAWIHYERLLGSGTVEYVEEPQDLDSHLKTLTRGAKASRDFWTDAYLAAFAQAGQMRLISFDAGFSRVNDLECLILEPQA
jgi:predicted nucleic acid-binding protein